MTVLINVEDSLFSCYKIKDSRRRRLATLSRATLYCEINTADQSLSEVGAVWNVKIPRLCTYYRYYPPGRQPFH